MSGRLLALTKNLLTAIVTLAVLIGGLEGVVRGLDLFARERAAVRSGPAAADADRESSIGYLIHPFLGWSVPPREGLDNFLQQNDFFPEGQPSDWAIGNSYFNVFGYRSSISDYRSLREDQHVVGVFGGSVAAQLAVVGGDYLVAELERRYPPLEGRVVVLNLGGGGYKQPQQVNTLVQMAMLGVPFDLILNVDGLNEVVFGAVDGHRHGIHPIFPSYGTYLNVLAFATGSVSNRQIETTAAILAAREKSRRLAALGTTHPVLRRSEVAAAVLGSFILTHQRRSERLEAELQRIDAERDRPLPLAEIPDPCLGAPDACWGVIADLWSNASRLMNALAEGLGARYAHFLQPNQYVPGSKRLSPQEQKVAYQEGVFSHNVPLGYPHLQSRGERLRTDGVAYHDLSGIFEDVGEPLYIDACCHLNAKGYELLAAAIVERLDDP